jgi:hypothetical protein
VGLSPTAITSHAKVTSHNISYLFIPHTCCLLGLFILLL